MNSILNFVLLGMFGGQEIIVLFIMFFAIAAIFIPLIFYLITLKNTFNEISSENQKMKPSQVWLTLIPFFGIVWQFIIVNKMANSLKLEFTKRNIKIEEDRPGISIGMTYCILSCCSIVPYLGVLTSIGALVCWIIYWVKINGYKIKLQETRIL